MDLIIMFIALVLSSAILLAAYIFGKKTGAHRGDGEAANLREESENLDRKLVEFLSESDRFASKAQVKFLAEQNAAFEQAVVEQQASSETIAERVEKTRSDVHNRERELQNLRATKEEDEFAISQTLARYHEFSAESLSLEQKLAESLRALDAMANEIKMTTDQQAVFSELSNALTQASAQLRDVIVDYQNANERLTTLSSRFNELEEEYSKLVEQQLAG